MINIGLSTYYIMKIPINIRNLPIFGRMTITKGQEKELDRLWAIAVKKRAWDLCEKCGKREPLQSHHVIGRRNKTLRHIVSNGCCLCAGCHMYVEQNGVNFGIWIINKRGQKWWNDLNLYAREVKVWKDFSIIKKYLEEFINE